jgi:16S rRNA (guanine527-N7)-methyltransferase
VPDLLAHHPDPGGLGPLSVSRETTEALTLYLADLLKWSDAINLVSTGTRADAWDRHICDSAQLFCLAPPGFQHWVDLGSGGGLPGLVIAILAREINPGAQVTLIESDKRKSSFLLLSARKYAPNCRVLVTRAETAPAQGADVVSARALARFSGLLDLASRHLVPTGVCLFPKGAQAADEISEANARWRFDIEQHQSRTAPDAVVLRVSGIEANHGA